MGFGIFSRNSIFIYRKGGVYMIKNYSKYILILFAVFISTFMGCSSGGSDDDENNEKTITKAQMNLIRKIDILHINEYSGSFEVSDENAVKLILNASGEITPTEISIVNKTAAVESIMTEDTITQITVKAVDINNNQIGEEVVIDLNNVSSKLDGLKKALITSIFEGIYIKTANTIELYVLDYLSALSFSERVNLITKFDQYAGETYIVLNDTYVLWENYVNLTSFSSALNVLSIISTTTVVYDIKSGETIYADGKEFIEEEEEEEETEMGLRGYYFSDMSLGNLIFTRLDSNVNFEWENGSPDNRVNTDNFSVVWAGYIEIPTAGNYTFYTLTDDGVKLWFEGEVIIDKWVNQAPTKHDSKIMNLEAGKYKIQMEYYENAGGATAILGWTTPTTFGSGEAIPSSYLSPGNYIEKSNINIDEEEIRQKTILTGSVSRISGYISEVVIDWGDGSELTYIRANFDNINVEHDYLLTGEFVIKVTAVDNEGYKTNESINIISSEDLRLEEKIIFLGDSITQQGYEDSYGYVRVFETEYAEKHPELNLEIIGAGIGGNRVADLQGRLEGDVLSKNPDTVVVYIGINDVWNTAANETPEQFRAGLEDVIGRILASGARAVLCTPSVIGELKNNANSLDENLDIFSDVSRSVAAENNILLIDLRKAFVDYLADNNPNNLSTGILTTDGVHLNETGNRFVADQILNNIDTLQN